MPPTSLLEKTPKEREEISPAYRQSPSNVEAEQGLLGALLVNNEALSHLGDNLRADHFHEPVHTRIFEAVQKFHNRGLLANPDGARRGIQDRVNICAPPSRHGTRLPGE